MTGSQQEWPSCRGVCRGSAPQCTADACSTGLCSYDDSSRFVWCSRVCWQLLCEGKIALQRSCAVSCVGGGGGFVLVQAGIRVLGQARFLFFGVMSVVSLTFLVFPTAPLRRVNEIDVKAETSPEPGSNTLSRILAVFSHVLLMLYRRSNPEAAAKTSPQKTLPSIASLASMVRESECPPYFLNCGSLVVFLGVARLFLAYTTVTPGCSVVTQIFSAVDSKADMSFCFMWTCVDILWCRIAARELLGDGLSAGWGKCR